MNFAPVFSSWDILLKALVYAVTIGLVSFFLATIMASVVTLLRLSRYRVLRSVAFVYTQLFRGISLYVLLIWVYFGLSIALGWNLSALAAGIASLTLLLSAYLSEIFRAAVDSVDGGQTEAASALGLRPLQTYRRVVGPQAAQVAVGPAGDMLVMGVKDTAVLTVIGVAELMFKARELTDFYAAPLEFYTAAAVLYIITVTILKYGLGRLDVWVSRNLHIGDSSAASDIDSTRQSLKELSMTGQ